MANQFTAWDPTDGIHIPPGEPDRMMGFDETVEQVWVVQLLERNGYTLDVKYSTEDVDRPLRILSCHLSGDRTRRINWEGTVQLAMDDDSAEKFVPQLISDPLSPVSGHFLRVYMGARSPVTGIRWMCPVATLEIDTTEVEVNDGELTLTLHGQSVERKFERGRLNLPGYGSTIAGTAIEAVSAIVNRIAPWASIDNSLGIPLMGSGAYQITWDDNPLDLLYQIVGGDPYGARLWFDSLSNFHMKSWSPYSLVQWFAGETIYGDEDPTQKWINVRSTNVRYTWSGEQTYNGVLLRCQNFSDGTALTGVFFDDRTSEPTFYNPADPSNTKIGPNPLFASYTLAISNQAEADFKAKTRFDTILRPSRRVVTRIRTDPRVELSDWVNFSYDKVGLAAVTLGDYMRDFFVDAIDMEMGAPTMTVTLKEHQVHDGSAASYSG